MATDPRQLDVTTAMVHFIAEDLQALSVVDSPAFKKFVEKLNPSFTMPTQKTISYKHLPQVQFKLKAALKKADHVCLTIDIWTSRDMRSYLGITCHYIENMQMKSGMLACKRFRGRHTAENIHEEYENVVEAFELQGRVSAVITDNAANMVKAFALPGMATFANNDDDNDDQIDHDPLSDDGASVESDPEMLRFVTDHFGCFCHTLQLIVKDALKDAAGINKVIAKLARLVKHVRHSTIASELLEDDYKLVMACAPKMEHTAGYDQVCAEAKAYKSREVGCCYKTDKV